jgi:hypothetical protein
MRSLKAVCQYRHVGSVLFYLHKAVSCNKRAIHIHKRMLGCHCSRLFWLPTSRSEGHCTQTSNTRILRISNVVRCQLFYGQMYAWMCDMLVTHSVAPSCPCECVNRVVFDRKNLSAMFVRKSRKKYRLFVVFISKYFDKWLTVSWQL